MIVVLVPAHKAGYRFNRKPQIVETIESLQAQTVAPDRIVVLANNGGVTDGTIEASVKAGAEAVIVPPNPDKFKWRLMSSTFIELFPPIHLNPRLKWKLGWFEVFWR